ncbi:MAG: hypothetical protein FWG99_01635 [Treponema sp.]|nr:hypothetical protein [Treponema sp.]
MRFSFFWVFLTAAAALLSCNGNTTALIWTDRPELAFYGEYFNTAQGQYKVEIRYFDFPAAELKNSNIRPDIIVGSWLKNSQTGTYFKSMNNYFGANKLSDSIFYPRLLSVGKIGRRQYLLPVSFNAPAVIFTREKAEGISNPFTIGFEELKMMGRGYNTENNGAYTQMGFSPIWNNDFLYAAVVLFNTSFREASPIAWDTAALDRSMRFVYNWNYEINTSSQSVEDFTFKYFFDPPAKLVQSGRILFSYMESSSFFTLSEDSRGSLDYRWVSEQNRIPLTDDTVYLGIPRKGKSPRAAAAFINWFFQTETQQQLLESSRANRMDETVFGICGGFSALRPVTEQIFPRFYTGLLGRMPPAEFLFPADNLPGNWTVIKERLILPYLHDRSRSESADAVYPLERRIADWTRIER